jgi:hypothetical protein
MEQEEDEGAALVARLEAERVEWRLRICHEARVLQQDPLFRYEPVLDQEAFRRDGVWVLPGIYTEAATARLLEACKRIQRCNDEWVNHDWLAPPMRAAWTAAGLRPPSALAPSKMRESLTGGTQKGARDSSTKPGLFDGSDFIGLQEDRRAPHMQGFCPEAFACGYDPMLLNAFTHPQMLALQRQMLGSELRFDHCLVFNRKAGFPGGMWHSHAYTQDGQGQTTRNPPLGEVRNLLYPEGFEQYDDGGLSVVRGGHLYRDHTLREKNDDEMDAGWLAGRLHPITAHPLVRERLALPPGSLVAALTHAPHYVDRRRSGVRYGALMVYANPDPQRRLPRDLVRRYHSELSEAEKQKVRSREPYGDDVQLLRRSAVTPTTHVDSVPVEWVELAAAGEVPGVCGQHANLFTEE